MDATKHPDPPHSVGHETSDVNIWAIGKYAAGLVGITIVSLVLLIGMFKYFQSREESMKAKEIVPEKIFPQPQVLQNEPVNLKAFRENEEKLLTGYGWVDQPKGVVRIPVNQAIDLMVKRGLPARAQAPAPSAVVSQPTESGLGQAAPEAEKK